MPANASATYYVSLCAPGGANVGVWYITEDQEDAEAYGQPVILGVGPIRWTATPPIVPYVDAALGVGPFKYTGVVNGEVFASNDPNKSQKFHFIRIAQPDCYYVSIDPVGNYVWTAGAKGDPIKIRRFTGEPNQTFKFVRKS